MVLTNTEVAVFKVFNALAFVVVFALRTLEASGKLIMYLIKALRDKETIQESQVVEIAEAVNTAIQSEEGKEALRTAVLCVKKTIVVTVIYTPIVYAALKQFVINVYEVSEFYWTKARSYIHRRSHKTKYLTAGQD